MKQLFVYLSRFNRREQSVLLLGALIVFLFLLWKLMLVPLQEWHAGQVQRNAAAVQTLGRVKILGARLASYRQEGGQNGGQGEGNISRLIDTTLRENNLSMSGFQPGTGGEVRVRFDQVPYDRFIQWLHDMEYKHEVSVTDMSVAATNEQGQINVNIRMQQK